MNYDNRNFFSGEFVEYACYLLTRLQDRRNKLKIAEAAIKMFSLK